MKISFLAFLLGFGFILQAQTTDSIAVSVGEMDTVQIEVEKYHSPHRASIYSAVLPGLGQIYNKKYWKAPLVYAAVGGVGYAIYFNSKYYNIYRNAYRDFAIKDPGNTSYERVIPPGLTIADVQGEYAQWFEAALKNKKRYYRRYRDMSYFGMVAVYFINIIDASIDAHFYSFDVGDDLSFKMEPTYLLMDPEVGGALGVQLKLRF
jgi:hypothetical protein